MIFSRDQLFLIVCSRSHFMLAANMCPYNRITETFVHNKNPDYLGSLAVRLCWNSPSGFKTATGTHFRIIFSAQNLLVGSPCLSAC
jgi:hypothetical protein